MDSEVDSDSRAGRLNCLDSSPLSEDTFQIKVDTAVVRPATIQSKMKKRKREHKLVRKSKMKIKRIED